MAYLNYVKEVVPGLSPEYPVKVLIRKKRGNGYEALWDQGRRIEKNQDEGIKYELKNEKRDTGPISFSAIEEVGNEKLVQLTEADNGEFVEAEYQPNQEVIEEVSVSKQSQAFRHNRYNQARTLHNPKGILEKYQSIISMVMFGVFLILAGFGFSKMMQGWSANIEQASNTFMQAAKTVAASQGGG